MVDETRPPRRRPDPPLRPKPASDGGSEVLPRAGSDTKNPWQEVVEAIIVANSTPSRSRILPRQDDELPSIWDLYMAATLSGLAVSDTGAERDAELAARYADASIQERKKREND